MLNHIETIQDVIDHAKNNISECLAQLKLDCSVDQNEIKSEIENLLDSNDYPESEVVYYKEAWDIVAGSDFNDFEVERLDFSSCENSLDCLMYEAQSIITSAYYFVLRDAIKSASEQMQDVINTALEVGASDYCNLVISASSNYGWAVHNRETESGIAIYDDKPGHFHPEKLEGELYAVEGSVNSSYCSVCWNPEKGEMTI